MQFDFNFYEAWDNADSCCYDTTFILTEEDNSSPEPTETETNAASDATKNQEVANSLDELASEIFGKQKVFISVNDPRAVNAIKATKNNFHRSSQR